MDNQERERDVQQEEKALKLFGLLQNVPEDLLERSEKKRPGVIAFIRKHNTTLVACIALVLVGVGFLVHRTDNATSSETALDVGNHSYVTNDGAMGDAAEELEGAQEKLQEEQPEEQQEAEYVADNQDIADLFQSAVKGTSEEAAEAETDAEAGTAAAPEAGEAAPVGLISVLDALVIPEGYIYESITSSQNDGKELLVLRLKNEADKYMELQLRAGDGDASSKNEEQPMIIKDLGGNIIEQTEEGITLPVEEGEAAYLNVQYADGMTVHYNGTADAREVYQMLKSIN